MRVRAHNAALKKYRLINEGKRRNRAKAIAQGTPPTKAANRLSVSAGDVFGSLTALHEVEPKNGNQRWMFACGCGAELEYNVSQARSYLKRFGWSSCPDCWREAVARGVVAGWVCSTCDSFNSEFRAQQPTCWNCGGARGAIPEA